MCLGIPGRIVNVVEADTITRTAKVDFSGVKKMVSLAFVPEAREGDYVIVHAGFAIGILDEQEARETLRYLQEMENI